MNIRAICGMAAVAVAMSGLAASAQDKMSKPMEMGKEKSYTAVSRRAPRPARSPLGTPPPRWRWARTRWARMP